MHGKFVLIIPTSCVSLLPFFFFSSRRRHTRSTRDWSSDVCSSDLDACARRISPLRDRQLGAAREALPPQPWVLARPRLARCRGGRPHASCWVAVGEPHRAAGVHLAGELGKRASGRRGGRSAERGRDAGPATRFGPRPGALRRALRRCRHNAGAERPPRGRTRAPRPCGRSSRAPNGAGPPSGERSVRTSLAVARQGSITALAMPSGIRYASREHSTDFWGGTMQEDEGTDWSAQKEPGSVWPTPMPSSPTPPPPSPMSGSSSSGGGRKTPRRRASTSAGGRKTTAKRAPPRRKATAKRSTAKRSTAKRSTAKRTTAKRGGRKTTARRKTTGRSTAKRTTRRSSATRKKRR